MANHSDHPEPHTNLFELLPEVLRSETNKSVLNTSFDRMLTKDDTTHVSGYVGTPNPSSLTNRQLPEPTPQLQAFQLQPTIYSKVGTVETAMSFKAYQEQLTLMGVDFLRMQEWGNTIHFNWVPPVNLDMVVNFTDYYWEPVNPTDLPQYLTIENRCEKELNVLTAYDTLVQTYGETFPIVEIDVGNNSVTVDGQLSTLFIENFRVWIKDTLDINIRNRFFTVQSSSYSLETQTAFVVGVDAPARLWVIAGDFRSVLGPGIPFTITNNTGGADGTYTVSSTTFGAGNTTILVNEDIPLTAVGNGTCTIDVNICVQGSIPIQTTIIFDPDISPMAIRSPTMPPPSVLGRYWVDTSTMDLDVYCWNGFAWVPCTPVASGIISLEELHDVLRVDANCVCSGDFGWDLALWDDNQAPGDPPWTFLLGPYAQPFQTSGESAAGVGDGAWIAFNGIPTALALWLDTTLDGLYQRNPGNTAWILVIQDWSVFVGDKLKGDILWDLTASCAATLQVGNQWTQQNKWIHKSRVSSFAGVRRAQAPILEYDSRVEMNKWTELSYSWKYRPITTGSFSATTSQPTRLELEPVKGWLAVQPGAPGTAWYLYLFDKNATEARDINYATTFVPGFTFLVVSDIPMINNSFTVDYSIYREGAPSDPLEVQGGYLVTIVKLVELGAGIDAFFTTTPQGGGVNHARIEPQITTLGDIWRGYQVHWFLDLNSMTSTAAGSQVGNPMLNRAIEQGDPYSFSGVPSVGPMVVGEYFQETTITGVGVTNIALDASFRFIDQTFFTIVAPLIVGVNGTWSVLGNHAAFFTPGMSFVIPNNGAGNGIYTVLSALDVGPNTEIIVNETIPALATVSGTILTGRSLFALAGQDQIRVYKNNIQQYGTYVELSAIGVPDYTAVGTSIYTTQSFNYVTNVVFTTPLTQYDIIRIEVGPAALSDMGMQYVPVRTIEDETAFLAAVLVGTQPTYLGRNSFDHKDQVKTLVNQYPLFDMYDVCSGNLISASPLFAYREDPSAPVNRVVQKRIVTSDGGREFGFVQFMLAEDNGQIYGYRLLDGRMQPSDYWYNPSTGILLQWNGVAWQTLFVIQDSGTGLIETHVPFVGATPPTYLVTIENSIWYDPTTQLVYKSNGITWVVQALPKQDDSLVTPAVAIEGGDPTLTTVWRSVPQYTDNTSGPPSTWTGGTYIPQWVDGDNNPIPVGDPGGDWEIPDQWRLNPEHHNRTNISYSELVTHFRSIVDAQPNPFSFPGGGISGFSQADFNYSLGGTIKEHNDSYDTLVSAVNLINVTPPGVIEFAQQQYADLLLAIKELFNRNLVTMLSNLSVDALTDLPGFVAETVISAYEANDFYAEVYVDTSAFDAATNVGMRNWISTVPMFALGPVIQPVMDIDVKMNLYQILHHDGHRSSINFTAAEEDSASRILCVIPDTRVTNGTIGKIATTPPPCFMSVLPFVLPSNCPNTTFSTQFGVIRNGVYWYQTSNPRALYRFNVIAVTPVAPSGTGVPVGAFYWNSMLNQLFTWNGSAWIAAAPVQEISLAWELVDMRLLLANTLLTVENQLYAITPKPITEFAFDYASLTPNPSEQAFYDQYNEEQFFAFIARRRIRAPFENFNYTPSDAFTWNYVYSSVTTPPTFSITPGLAASWQQLYTLWYGTPYPHLEPWSLQGFIDKPDWWDAFYLDATETYHWRRDGIHDMWANIRVGIIPTVGTTPTGVPGTGLPGQITLVYNYVSVNTGTVVIAGNYAPDDVLPPYYSTSSPTIRSFFTSLSTEIVAPGANYAYGDGGPTEWQWLVSGEHVYDPLVVAFRMQPVRFMHYAWGIDFIRVNNLQLDPTFCQVYNHEDALFHGDIYDNNIKFLVRGMNQWYVNYNRYVGYDTNKEFRVLWTQWNPLLTYQFSGIIDTSTLQVTNKYFDVGPQDYNVILANMGVIKDMWSDAFEVVILNMPPALISYSNQAQWKMELETLAAIPRAISYYDVMNYPFVVDVSTNTATFYRYAISGALSVSNLLEVNGDHVTDFPHDTVFDVIDSTANNGTYTVVASIYDPSTDKTRITTLEALPSSVVDGMIDLPNNILPWQTGDLVFITSSQLLPAPLVQYQPLYIIRLTNRTFRVSDSPNDATVGLPFIWTTPGTGDLNVGQVTSSFQVLGGTGPSKEIWNHYTVDKTKVRNFTPPYSIAGIQRLLNIIDGYQSYQTDLGVLYNLSDFSELDPETGRNVDWQLEEERFIDWAFRLRRTRLSVADKYPFVVLDQTDNTLQFTGQIPTWSAGMAIVMTSTGLLPEPFIGNTPYYYYPSTTISGVFQLSTTRQIAASIVDILSNGSGIMFVAPQNRPQSFPSFEMNPARNNLWVATPQGVLANVIQGPYADIRVQQTIFDQYARPLTADKLLIFREDTLARLAMRTGIANDVVPPSVSTVDPYNLIHMGGAHLFIEGIQHVVLFNDYTTSNQILYDSFLGLQAQRFGLDFYEKKDYTLRPTLGGYYLLDGKFLRNIEGQTVDSQNYYDTYALKEQTKVGHHSRALVGYREGQMKFMDLLNTNAKTQFIFYRGMIQAKGSTNAIKAYINSRRFVDAKVDEFWAWKIADFGDVRPKVYPEIKLFASDGQVDDIRLEFLTDSEASDKAVVAADKAQGFNVITFADQSRWIDAPQQQELLHNSILFLDSKVTSLTTIYASDVVPTSGQETVDLWYQKSTGDIFVWNGTSWVLTTDVNVKITTVGTDVYVQQPVFSDTVRITHRQLVIPGDLRNYTTSYLQPGTGPSEYERINSQVVRFTTFGFSDIIMLFTINPAKTQNSPGKIIDYVSETVLTDVPYWDPARGNHSIIAIHNVNIQNAGDPALYTNTLNPNDVSEQAWNQHEIQTVWLDTSTLAYLPYYDDIISPQLNDRLYSWGRFADWGQVRVFQWVESEFTPEQWTATASNEADNTAIPSNTKITGTPRNTVFKRERIPIATTVNVGTDELLGANGMSIGDQALLTINGTITPTRPTTGVNPDLFDSLATSMTAIITITVVPAVYSESPAIATITFFDIPAVVPATLTNLANGLYDFTFAVNGGVPVNYTITITGATTVTQLAAKIMVVLVGIATTVEAAQNTITITALDLQLPLTTTTTLASSTKYYVTLGTTASIIKLSDVPNGTAFEYGTGGIGTLAVVPAFKAINWTPKPVSSQQIIPIIDGYTLPVPPLFTLDSSLFSPGDVVNTYLNGRLSQADLTVDSLYQIPNTAQYVLRDIIMVVRPIPVVTPEEAAFDPDASDDGTTNVQLKEMVQYTQRVVTFDTIEKTLYYFWVENRLNKIEDREDALPLIQVAQQLAVIPTPYLVVQRPEDDPTLADRFGYGITYGTVYSVPWIYDLYPVIPVFYRQAIIRKAADYVRTDNRYEMRFTRDLTLRDNLDDGYRPVNLKDKHQEWLVIRREQGVNIDRYLWNRLTESLIFYKLADPSIRVPALERTLYDEMNGTDTQYGLGEAQAFTDGTLSLQTVIAYLEDPNNDFYPLDINSFFATYSFDTPANIAISMDVIYNTFGTIHVNNIWFNTLLDAFSVKSKYPQIFKTSWVALHGIRVLEVAGLFDD